MSKHVVRTDRRRAQAAPRSPQPHSACRAAGSSSCRDLAADVRESVRRRRSSRRLPMRRTAARRRSWSAGSTQRASACAARSRRPRPLASLRAHDQRQRAVAGAVLVTGPLGHEGRRLDSFQLVLKVPFEPPWPCRETQPLSPRSRRETTTEAPPLAPVTRPVIRITRPAPDGAAAGPQRHLGRVTALTAAGREQQRTAVRKQERAPGPRCHEPVGRRLVRCRRAAGARCGRRRSCAARSPRARTRTA